MTALFGITGCSSGGDSVPSQLVDGTRALTPAVRLDAPSPLILTKAASIRADDATPGTPAGACLQAAREHGVTAPVVVRTGVSGQTVTFRAAAERALVACDATHAIRPEDASWCGRALGRLDSGLLLDPRLDLAGCETAEGDPIAFAWVTPGDKTAYIAVRQRGYTEVYPVAGTLPIRVTSGTIASDRSSATFDVSEYAAGGALLRSSTVEPRVAG